MSKSVAGALNLRSIHGAEAALLAFLVHDDCQPINLKGQRFQGMSKAHNIVGFDQRSLYSETTKCLSEEFLNHMNHL